jgi:molybdopterin/thiamine biosynthesis adenylyltransferase
MRINLHDAGLSPHADTGFDYSEAFSRNIGWITEWEQQELRNKTVAIAGMGGVGGAHALTLARLGIGGLHIADFDRFDVANLNRQAGAFISTLNLDKTAILAHMTQDINPELRQKIFAHGVDDTNLDEFLSGVDLFVDGLDFFATDIRRKTFKRCAQRGIPAITAAPIGFGATYLIFMPGAMTFEEYFQMEGLSEERQYVNMALGLNPKRFEAAYLADPSRLNLADKRGPSTAAAVQLCSGVVGAEVVKILLRRGKVYAAPFYHQFDAYHGRWHRGYLRYGNVGPLQSLKRYLGYRTSARLSRNARPAETPAAGSQLMRILDLARWAPSSYNSQPWRFEITGDDTLIVHIQAEGEDRHAYGDASGQATLISGGFLLATIRISASSFGRAMRWTYLGSENSATGSVQHRIEVRLPKDSTIDKDPLCRYIPIRSVDRRAYQMVPLTPAQKAELNAAIGGELRIEWRETFWARWSLARLCARSTDFQLRQPECFRVHKRILDWSRRFSPDGVPAASVGIDPVTLRLTRWAVQSWKRVDVLNRFFAATAIPRLELDLIPGICCAAYFLVSREPEPCGGYRPEALLQTGEHLQRLWLTATRLGLAIQPTFSPLYFARSGRSSCSSSPKLTKLAHSAAGCLPGDGSVLFLGRIGVPRRSPPWARSIRRNLTDLAR